ncbi:hypothetical protein M9H77_21791 [Catharanthus roseus]|uniref:Uncharacterized protein n=1 Tax=Catharanthus roseus TaxID=4058 RepID=A0ACC0ASQ6_CATRO|nr:hypothetical protein M9H77_21791 [Catharanthus roseus]
MPFNCFAHMSEKKGGRHYPPQSSNLFAKFIDEATLIDLGFSGYPFTKNLIDALLDQNNLWVIERGKIGDAFIKYYSGLFNSSGPNFPTDLEALGQPSISEAQNDILCIVPSEKAIQAVVFNMENGKNPSQDGMTVSFYKSYWL